MGNSAVCHAERALDALARGERIILAEGQKRYLLRAAELAVALIPAESNSWLVLSSARASHLGLGAQAVAFEAGILSPESLDALLFAAALQSIPLHRPARTPEEIAVALVKRAGRLPAALVVPLDAARLPDVPILLAEEAEAYLAKKEVELHMLPPVRLPLKIAQETRMAAFGEQSGRTHLAILIGRPEEAEAPLARLHSSCLTGDLLGSLRCDCGDQLQMALTQMAQAGAGVLLYLDQEGRGIGIFQKLRAYALQDQGLDTVDANRALGFEDDERDFTLAAAMLKKLGFARIRLLTNNPQKAETLSACGIAVEARVPLRSAPQAYNAAYLATKAGRMGHKFD